MEGKGTEMPFAVGEFVFPRIINSMFFCQGTIISQSEKQFQGKEYRGAMFLIFFSQKQKKKLPKETYLLSSSSCWEWLEFFKCLQISVAWNYLLNILARERVKCLLCIAAEISKGKLPQHNTTSRAISLSLDSAAGWEGGKYSLSITLSGGRSNRVGIWRAWWVYGRCLRTT